MASAGRIRLLYLIGSLDRGGTAVHLTELVRRLDPRRFAVEICCLGSAGPLADGVRQGGIPVHSLGVPIVYRPGFAAGMFRLSRLVRRGRYEVVHGLLFASDVFGTLAARLGGAPFVVNSRRMMPADEMPRRRQAYRLANRWVDRTVAPSEAVRRSCLELEGLAPERVVTIYNGIDPDRIRSASPAADLSPAEGPWLLTAGGINPLKGHETLVQALPAILQRFPAARVAVAGDGPLRDAVVALAERLEVRHALVLLGVRSDVPALLARADLFVQPSDSEGMSNAVLEAMAAGRAVVATAVGGNPEVVQDGATGILVPPGDPAALAQAAIELLGDPDRRRSLGARGSDRVDRVFTVQRMAEAAGVFYEGLVAAGKTAAARAGAVR